MISKKRKVLVSLASVAMLGGITLGSVGAFAAEVGRETTDVQARFSGETPPPDLTDTLQLITVPQFAGFGTADNSPGLEAGNAVQRTGYISSNRAVVRDARPDNTTGEQWKLSAAATSLTATNDDGTTETISDTPTNFANITLKSAGENAANFWTPSSNELPLPGIDGPAATGVTKDETTVLPLGGEAREFASATSTLGNGYTIPIDSMELNIASTNSEWAGKTFSGSIAWTLDNTM